MPDFRDGIREATPIAQDAPAAKRYRPRSREWHHHFVPDEIERKECDPQCDPVWISLTPFNRPSDDGAILTAIHNTARNSVKLDRSVTRSFCMSKNSYDP